MKKQLFDLEADLARLLGLDTDFAEQMMKEEAIPSDLVEYEEELAALRSGEAAFFWESPPAASPEEAVSMAQQAAVEMAPEPGREILAVFLHITRDEGWDFEAIEKVANSIQESFAPENKGIDFGLSCVYGDEGAHFILITAEGKKEMRKVVCIPKPIRSAEKMGEEELIDIAMEMAFETGYITSNMLMRRFMWGYTRTAMLLDRMAEAGLISSSESKNRRRPLMTPEQWKAAKEEKS